MSGTDETDKPGQVLTHERFVGKGDAAPAPSPQTSIEGLLAQGIDVRTVADLEDLEIADPAPDEQIVGTLSNDERRLYAAFYRAHKAFDQFCREIGGNQLVSMGEAIKAGQDEQFMDGGPPALAEEQAQELFRMQRKSEYLKATFFWTLCERIGYHDCYLSVRSKARVVLIRRKW